MNDGSLFPAVSNRPTLPGPTRERWQPLRLGLVELFHYDSEEFWFRDGHLLLRGNNGTGKSKALSLTLPFLLDAQLKPSRIEPDGDGGKKMSWNLLLNSYDRRIGYAWIEFGRLEDGIPHYLSLGAGLSATAARPNVESWFFVIEDAPDSPRINQDFWLVNGQRIVLSKEHLRNSLEGHGQFFETAKSYRRAVDERLFQLGEKRYEALMDTLIQLRQPQLSKKPDESALSAALTEALPPLSTDLLGDVAEALGQLEEDRRQIEEYQSLADAVERFNQRYRIYAATQSRRQTRILRQAQTEFDNASRQRGEVQARLEAARVQELSCRRAYEEAELALRRHEASLEALRSEPGMEDANRLGSAERDVKAREHALQLANAASKEAYSRLRRSLEEMEEAGERAAETDCIVTRIRASCAGEAEGAGLAATHATNPLAGLPSSALGDLAPRAFDAACADLHTGVTQRREQISLLRKRRAEADAAMTRYTNAHQARDEIFETLEAALRRREQADAHVEEAGKELQLAWDGHFAGLKQLQLKFDDAQSALGDLSEWISTLLGENPARRLLRQAQQEASTSMAQRGVALEGQRKLALHEHTLLSDERTRLAAGADKIPPIPYARRTEVRRDRAGLPFWQAVSFHDHLGNEKRAGIEAALEASGLLDAWISPDGKLQTEDGGTPLHDTQLVGRKHGSISLANWLHAEVPETGDTPATAVEYILASIACADDDAIDAEAWIAPDGRFRLGPLVGAWNKPAAEFIGFEARLSARRRRLAEIETRLKELDEELSAIESRVGQLARDNEQAAREWNSAPLDETLQTAHIAATAAARDVQPAREKLSEADVRLHEAEQFLGEMQRQLAADATDLRLPMTSLQLDEVETALNRYYEAQLQLRQAIRELRLVMPELERRRSREQEARDDLIRREEQSALARSESEEAVARFTVLRDSIGAEVDELLRRQADARSAVEACAKDVRRLNEDLHTTGRAHAVASEHAAAAHATWQERGEARVRAVARLQEFVASGLLLSAWPAAEIPDLTIPWTIDPALTLARRTEQALSDVRDDDEAWGRAQRFVSEDFTLLQRSLTALNHGAQAETSDWGLIVRIIYQNRAERPDFLSSQLALEISQRSELLTTKEREILENHLQAEIASEIQHLMQAAHAQTDVINKELYRRPTSTGVRFRLMWQPMSEEDGAPVGLAEASKRLLNTNADMWSRDDREVVGTMLRQRITAERERADSAKEGGGSLLDQLARALDYRHWHRFRIERLQDGSWRKLSGPASSGERALGLTVPLFAAIASFYGQGSSKRAPRLMLLDEAFAGIDDAARAHCMGLIREFDLDFVITSEREWACYAELPGVSICQLQRREGIDAVHVSRWTWDGRTKSRQADPDRRFSST
jgi:uncharacterized protein (TIGR02680 family)